MRFKNRNVRFFTKFKSHRTLVLTWVFKAEMEPYPGMGPTSCTHRCPTQEAACFYFDCHNNKQAHLTRWDIALTSCLASSWEKERVFPFYNSFATCDSYKSPAFFLNIQAPVHSPSRRRLSLSPRLGPFLGASNSTALHSTIALHLPSNFFALFGPRTPLISDSSASFLSTAPPQLHSWLSFHYAGYTDCFSTSDQWLQSTGWRRWQ
jgi:hypothetical protein